MKIALLILLTVTLSACASLHKRSSAPSAAKSDASAAQAANPDAEISAIPNDTSESDVPALKTQADTTTSSTDAKYKPLAQAIRAGSSKQINNEAARILGTNSYDPVALNALALLHLKRGQTGATKLLLNKAIERNPDNAALYNNLGVALSMENDDAGALASYKKALKANPSHGETLGNLGSIYMKGGDVTRAMPLLEQAYKANRSNLAVANNYAIALRMSGDLEGASRIYNDVLKSDARNLNAMINQAILLVDFMNKPKDGLTLVYKIKFLETDKKDVVARANALEKKAKAALQ